MDDQYICSVEWSRGRFQNWQKAFDNFQMLKSIVPTLSVNNCLYSRSIESFTDGVGTIDLIAPPPPLETLDVVLVFRMLFANFENRPLLSATPQIY